MRSNVPLKTSALLDALVDSQMERRLALFESQMEIRFRRTMHHGGRQTHQIRWRRHSKGIVGE
jgi:hypothetical protein